jgi:hypothetical protein
VNITNSPFLVFAFSLAALRLSAPTGAYSRGRRGLEESEREDFKITLGAILILLGLIIVFTFSMALTRYAQRKSCEDVEANAIGPEYVRASLLPPSDTATLRGLLSAGWTRSRLTLPA